MLTDTGAIREKIPGRFQICGTTLGLRCGPCQSNKRLPQALYSEDELPPLGQLTTDIWNYMYPEGESTGLEISLDSSTINVEHVQSSCCCFATCVTRNEEAETPSCRQCWFLRYI
jgi:hypothetical protein